MSEKDNDSRTRPRRSSRDGGDTRGRGCGSDPAGRPSRSRSPHRRHSPRSRRRDTRAAGGGSETSSADGEAPTAEVEVTDAGGGAGTAASGGSDALPDWVADAVGTLTAVQAALADLNAKVASMMNDRDPVPEGTKFSAVVDNSTKSERFFSETSRTEIVRTNFVPTRSSEALASLLSVDRACLADAKFLETAFWAGDFPLTRYQAFVAEHGGTTPLCRTLPPGALEEETEPVFAACLRQGVTTACNTVAYPGATFFDMLSTTKCALESDWYTLHGNADGVACIPVSPKLRDSLLCVCSELTRTDTFSFEFDQVLRPRTIGLNATQWGCICQHLGQLDAVAAEYGMRYCYGILTDLLTAIIVRLERSDNSNIYTVSAPVRVGHRQDDGNLLLGGPRLVDMFAAITVFNLAECRNTKFFRLARRLQVATVEEEPTGYSGELGAGAGAGGAGAGSGPTASGTHRGVDSGGTGLGGTGKGQRRGGLLGGSTFKHATRSIGASPAPSAKRGTRLSPGTIAACLRPGDDPGSRESQGRVVRYLMQRGSSYEEAMARAVQTNVGLGYWTTWDDM